MRKNIFIFLLPLVIFFSFFIFYFWPKTIIFWLAIFLIWIILILTFWQLLYPRLNESFLFIGQIFVLVLIISFLLIFLSRSLLFILLLAGLCLILYIYLKNIYRLLYQPRFCQPYYFETTALPLNFIIIFLLVAETDALIFVYRLSTLIVFSGLFLFFFWLNFYYFSLKGLREISVPAFVGTIVLIEFYLGFHFLPLSIHLNGLILGLIFVILVKIWQKKELKFL